MAQTTAPPDGLSRRRFLRHAVVAAWTAPIIVSMTSRAAEAGEALTCGTKIGGAGSTACKVTTPCGTAAVGCKASPAAPAGSPCYCI